MAVFHDFGIKGFPRDQKIALKWYEKVAIQGHPIAQYNLGVFYDEGIEVPRDFKLALQDYKKAALQGDHYAQCNLGVCYDKGKGGAQNLSKALIWYERALQGNM